MLYSVTNCMIPAVQKVHEDTFLTAFMCLRVNILRQYRKIHLLGQ